MNKIIKILILSFLVILPFSLIYISIAKKTNRDFSSIRNEVDKDINRHIFENFTGIKELIYFQNKEFFTRKIYKNLNLQRRYNSYTYTLSQSTKYYIEFILIIILAVVYTYYLLTGLQLAQLFSSLAVFLMASVRILPIIARIQGNFQTYDFYKSSIELIAKDLSFYKLNRENDICFENFESIEGHNLSFKYGKKIIFEDFNFKIAKDLIPRSAHLFTVICKQLASRLCTKLGLLPCACRLGLSLSVSSRNLTRYTRSPTRVRMDFSAHLG